MLSPSLQSPMLKIAIYRSSSIGDVVLASACINLLKRLKMPTQIFWIGRQPALNLISKAFPEVISVELTNQDVGASRETVLNQIKEVHLIVDLQKNIKSQFICKSLGKRTGAKVFTWSRQSVARNKLVIQARLRGRSAALPEKVRRVERYKYQMMLLALRRALDSHLPVEMLDGLLGDAPPILPTHHDDGQRPWQKELKFGKWLAVAPGASYPAKQAPMDIFLLLLAKLKEIAVTRNGGASKGGGVGLVFLGGEEDRKITSQIIDQIGWPYSVLNLAGKLSLWESALALQDVSTLIANDTSLGHMAEAVGVPANVLFGPTVEAFGFAPHLNTSRAFSVDLGCRPCSKHGSKPCRYEDYLCFKLIAVDGIAQHIESLIWS